MNVKPSDQTYLDALTDGMTWAQWHVATGKTKSTFNTAVARLIARDAVVKQGDRYSHASFVTERGETGTEQVRNGYGTGATGAGLHAETPTIIKLDEPLPFVLWRDRHRKDQ